MILKRTIQMTKTIFLRMNLTTQKRRKMMISLKIPAALPKS